MKDPEAKRIMKKIAAGYGELAEQAALHEAERQNAEAKECVDRQDEGAAAVTQVTTVVGTFRSTVRQYILRLIRTIAQSN